MKQNKNVYQKPVIYQFGIIILFLSIITIANLSCKNIDNQENTILVPIDTSLRQMFPNSQTVLIKNRTVFLEYQCPTSITDSENFFIKVNITDSLEIDEIVCFAVILKRVVKIDTLNNKSKTPDDVVPLYTIKSERLFNEYYKPSSKTFRVKIPNVFFEKGEYDLEYGVFLKEDFNSEKVPFYCNICKYRVD